MHGSPPLWYNSPVSVNLPLQQRDSDEPNGPGRAVPVSHAPHGSDPFADRAGRSRVGDRVRAHLALGAARPAGRRRPGGRERPGRGPRRRLPRLSGDVVRPLRDRQRRHSVDARGHCHGGLGLRGHLCAGRPPAAVRPRRQHLPQRRRRRCLDHPGPAALRLRPGRRPQRRRPPLCPGLPGPRAGRLPQRQRRAELDRPGPGL